MLLFCFDGADANNSVVRVGLALHGGVEFWGQDVYEIPIKLVIRSLEPDVAVEARADRHTRVHEAIMK